MEYTISEIAKLGTKDEKYGQRWWGKVTEDLKPISFNVMEGEFQTGDRISFEESLNKRSQKGVDFLQLKKVRRAEQNQLGTNIAETGTTMKFPTITSVASGGVHEQLDRIEAKLDKLLGQDAELGFAAQQTQRDAQALGLVGGAQQGDAPDFTDADMGGFDNEY